MAGVQTILAIQQIQTEYRALLPLMDERMRRRWAAVEAQNNGWGGISVVAQATGLSLNTTRKGIVELVVNALPEGKPLFRMRSFRAPRTTRSATPGWWAAGATEQDQPVPPG